MPINSQKRPVRRKSIVNMQSPPCSCNYDSNHNSEESHLAKSPIKVPKSQTVYKQKGVKAEKALENNSMEKILSKKDPRCVSDKNQLISAKCSTSKNKKGSRTVVEISLIVTSEDARKSSKSTKMDSKLNDEVSRTKSWSSTNIAEPKISRKERRVGIRKADNNSLAKNNIKCISKEKKRNLKLMKHPMLKNMTVIETSLEPEKSKELQTTHLAPTDNIKASEKSQSQQSIKQCRVLLTPLPQKVLKEKHLKKTEIANKPKPIVIMNNMFECKVILKKSPTKLFKTTMPKVDGVPANQPNTLENNTLSNPAALSDEIKKTPKDDMQNNRDKVIKKPLVDRTNLNKPSPVPKFRKRKFMNYAESSLEMSRDIQKNVYTNKIPIYKQQPENEIKLKKHEDTYEFDSDSEQRKKRKKRKLNNSSSDEYNKTIGKILKNVAIKIKRKKKNLFPNYKNAKPMKPSRVRMKKENIVQNKPIVTSELKNNEVEKHITSEAGVKTHQSEEVWTENIEIQDYSDGDDNDIDFGFDDAEANKENSPKIKIISDIRLLPNKELNLSMGTSRKFRENKELNFSVGTPSKFKEIRLNTNSTMLNNVLTPWRFNDINIMRNPHFITLKESSLPCINQEMVLDHTMVYKFADTSKTELAKTPQRITDENPKKVIQSIVTDFFESNTDNKENENTQLSLFDNDQFSPIKNKHHFGNKGDSIKRRILGELNDNKKNVYASTPKQNATNLRVPQLEVANKNSATSKQSSSMEDSQKKQKSNREFTNFGFTSSDEEDVKQNSPKKDKADKPFRLNVSANDKKYPVKQKLKKAEKAQSVILSDAESELSDAKSHSGEARLFEDFADTDNDDRFLEPKIKKKKKLKWMNDYNTNTQKPKRRKDIRTKEEEEEAEKWAAAFNSMCQEIEKFPLEIE